MVPPAAAGADDGDVAAGAGADDVAAAAAGADDGDVAAGAGADDVAAAAAGADDGVAAAVVVAEGVTHAPATAAALWTLATCGAISSATPTPSTAATSPAIPIRRARGCCQNLGR